MLVRFLGGTVAGAITFFVAGFVIYGLLLKSYMDGSMTAAAKAVMGSEPNFGPLGVAQFVFGAIFTFIFEYWASIRTFVGGMKGGAIINFAISLGINMQILAFSKDMYVGSPAVPIALDVLGATLMGAIAGGVIGQVLGMLDKKTA